MPSTHAIDLTEPVGGADHVIGPPAAPVTVVEYGDFECPNCKQAAPAVRMLLEHFGHKVRFAFRHFPLEDVHPHALQAAESAECAAAQGKFWEMHELLFNHQTHLDLRDLRSYAAQIDLDLARYDAEMRNHVYERKVRADLASGRGSGVRGTPGFFVNGTLTDVSFGFQALLEVTKQLLEEQ